MGNEWVNIAYSRFDPSSVATFHGYVMSGASSNLIMIDGSRSGVRGSFSRSRGVESVVVVLPEFNSRSQPPLLLSRHRSSRAISCMLPPTAIEMDIMLRECGGSRLGGV